MKKVIPAVLALFAVLALAVPSQAHTLYMSAEDNDDGTVTVSGMYSTGTVAGATDVRVVDASERVLIEGRTDTDGEFTFQKPSVPYFIIMDAGPGHTARADGP